MDQGIEIAFEHAIDIALACEQAGRDSDRRIRNSDGASVSSNASLSVYANSHGFLGGERGTSHSIGCALIAGEGDAMQRDSWYSLAIAAPDLEPAAAIGREAGRSALARPMTVVGGDVPAGAIVSGTDCAVVGSRFAGRR